MRKYSYQLTAILLLPCLLVVAALLVVVVIVGSRQADSAIVRELAALRVVSATDADGDGVDDYTDIVQSARAQIGVVTSYDTSYYAGGYPPESTGACADVPWRALQGAGYDFKQLIDDDMRAYPGEYVTEYDANINFRRTQNIRVYLERHAESLTIDVVPNDRDNLVQWQGGDIVTFAQIPGGLWHVAVVSDRRQPDGVPYLIHNHGFGTRENTYLTHWPSAITGHYRVTAQALGQ